MDVNHGLAERINMNPNDVEQGLAQLVLTILELLRQLIERQAIKRVEGGTLTEEEIETLGTALMNLEVKMEELKVVFGLEGKDLNIDLGPLGNLM
ncbi:gas vesicle protein K [Bacillus sp. JJ664]